MTLDIEKLRALYEAAKPGTHIQAGRMVAWSYHDRETEEFFAAAFIAMPTILALAEREAEAQQREAEAIIACIRSTTWSGTEEIVQMIRERHRARPAKRGGTGNGCC